MHCLRTTKRWVIADLAAKGNAEGLYRAAIKLASGTGVDKDFDTSLSYMEAASALGHEQAVRFSLCCRCV